MEIFLPHRLEKRLFFDAAYLEKCSEIIKQYSEVRKIVDIKTPLLSGKIIVLPSFSPESIVICNGMFGKFYALDCDFTTRHFFYLGEKYIGSQEIQENITKILPKVSDIIARLQSQKLLTKSKKEQIEEEMKRIFFTLTLLLFTLEQLLYKTNKNIKTLTQQRGAKEYRAHSSLLQKTSEKKFQELSEVKKVLEEQTKKFLFTLHNFL